jgi:hypothetical protein
MEDYLEFDESGNLIEESENYFDLALFIKKSYIFNERGKMIDGKQYDCDGCIPSKIEFEYDWKGFLIGKRFYNMAGLKSEEIIYNFDWRGKLSEVNELQSDELFSKRKQYDNYGNLTIEEWYLSNADLKNKTNLALSIIYKYSENVLQVDAFFYDIDGNNYLIISDECDEYGNQVSSISFNPDGSIFSQSKYWYYSEDSGNWIYRISSTTGEPSSYTKRKIIY